MNRSQGRRPGFTLIEILIVIAIIAILVSIAIPNLFAARQSSDEASATGALRTINSAESTYKARHGMYGSIDDLYNGKLIDSVLASATSAATNKSGYFYVLTIGSGTNPQQYWVLATPTSNLGTRIFYTDETAAIYGDSTMSDSVSGDVSGNISALGPNWSAIGN